MSRTLDRKRYFAHVYGIDERGRRYMQDGIYFTGDGIAIDSVAAPTVPGPAQEKIAVVEQVKSAEMQTLEGMSAVQLKNVARKLAELTGAKLPVMSGTGVTQRLMKFITDNSVEY